MNILVIEDDPISQAILNVLLLRLKHSVFFSDGDEQTFEILQTRRPDLIISDFLLPNIVGSEIVRYIKKCAAKKIPVLLVSSLPKKELKQISEKCGADGFLSKPFINQELKSKIDEIVNKNTA